MLLEKRQISDKTFQESFHAAHEAFVGILSIQLFNGLTISAGFRVLEYEGDRR